MELYKAAACVLEKFENKQGSAKSLVFASGYKNIRQLYALVCESLKYQSALSIIFKSSHSLQQEDSLQGQDHLATVLLYEHLLGKGLGHAGPLRNCILKHKKEIQETCRKLLDERGVASLADLLSAQCRALNNLPIPRYVRVNQLKISVEAAVAMLSEEGWEWRGPLSLAGFRDEVLALGEEGFGADPLLSDLLVLPPSTDLHLHPAVTAGQLILQDRASCFPAHVLDPAQGSTVLDCCAAPGNKTTHAASLMNNTGKIWAFERDAKRMSLLKQQLKTSGVSNTKTLHQDFLSVDPHDERFADVQYVLVDPSCSGSGIMSRMDHVTPTTPSPRLLNLQRFQISILKHALRFPNARRVVYSTCSVHKEENEQVVAEVAPQVQDRFQVKTVFPDFPHRGEGSDPSAEKCVRLSPQEDLTNGFFVACFERISEDCGDGVSGMENEDCESRMAEREDGALKKKKKKNCGEKQVNEETVEEGTDVPSPKKKRKPVEEKDNCEEMVKDRYDVLSEKKKRKHVEENNISGEMVEDINCDPSTQKKKRKRKHEEESHASEENGKDSTNVLSLKKKRKRKNEEESHASEENGKDSTNVLSLKKKRKRKNEEETHVSEEMTTDHTHLPSLKKKRKDKKKEENHASEEMFKDTTDVLAGKKQKRKRAEEIYAREEMGEDNMDDPSSEKKRNGKTPGEKDICQETVLHSANVPSLKKKKKKKRKIEDKKPTFEESAEDDMSNPSSKKKVENKTEEEKDICEETVQDPMDTACLKKKKQKSRTSKDHQCTVSGVIGTEEHVQPSHNGQQDKEFSQTKKKKKHKSKKAVKRADGAGDMEMGRCSS